MATMEQIKARLAETDGIAAIATNEGLRVFHDIRSGNGYEIKSAKRWSFIFDQNHIRLGYWRRT